MEFGRIAAIEQVDFSLPPDDNLTEVLLAALRPEPGVPMKVYIGCAQWGYKEWIGKIYPKGTKDKDFLSHYVKQFNTIELNTLFYNDQPAQLIERWVSVAGAEFRFCPKFSNMISHTRQLQHVERETGLFLEHMQGFGSRLGPSFLQLSDSFGPDRASILQEYARRLPRDFKTCVELRHEDWFRKGAAAGGKGTAVTTALLQEQVSAARDTWALLRELGVGTVITDTPGRRDCLHMKLTAPVAFIRFVANNLHRTDFIRIDAWIDRLKEWMDKGLREIYFFIHNRQEVNTPDLCKYAVERLNAIYGLHLKPPDLLNGRTPGELTLF
jgi:uncharacterized protein YecE (DUF72 family)